jgi:sugar transferase EpsL
MSPMPPERRSSPAGISRLLSFGLKRVFDVTLALVALLVLSPLLAGLVVAVWIRLGRPIFFTQPRPGRGGRIFRMIKFRTMTDQRDASGRLRSDAERLTPFGAWLRSTSLDELPELWSIVKGDMSLVGPRPLLVDYLPRYTPEEARRHEVRPGLSGLAQVNGRNQTTWEERLQFDVWYVDHRSFLLDLSIIGRTIVQIIRRQGVNAKGEATMAEFRQPPGPKKSPSSLP